MLGCWVVVLVETGECRASPGVSSVKTTKKVSGAGRGGPRGSNREGLQDCSSWASQLPRVTSHLTSHIYQDGGDGGDGGDCEDVEGVEGREGVVECVCTVVCQFIRVETPHTTTV